MSATNVTVTLNATDWRRDCGRLSPPIECSRPEGDIDTPTSLVVRNRLLTSISMQFYFAETFSRPIGKHLVETGPVSGGTMIVIDGGGFSPTTTYTAVFTDTGGLQLETGVVSFVSTTRVNVTTPNWGGVYTVDRDGTTVHLYSQGKPVVLEGDTIPFLVRNR